MIRMVLSDLDGTLLDSQGNLPENFDKMIEELQHKNIIFAPASGRQYFTLREMFNAYKDEFLFIAKNGAYVVYRDAEIFSQTITPQQVKSILQSVDYWESQEIHIVLCGKNGAYLTSTSVDFLDEVKKYYHRYKIVNDLSSINDDFSKIAFCDSKNKDAVHTIYPQLSRLNNDFQVMLSAKIWVDIMPKNANKGTAINKIQEILHLSPNECVAFGDYQNDIEMLNSVHYSFAVENAQEAVKKIAKFRTQSNDQQGVVRAIQNLKRRNLI